MKIIIRMEDGHPILFFPEEKEVDGRIPCWAQSGEHSTATRGYMRKLKAPAPGDETRRAWVALGQYAGHVAYVENIAFINRNNLKT